MNYQTFRSTFKASLPLLLLSALGLNAQNKPHEIFQSFEGDGYELWTTEGDAFGLAPSAGGQGDIAWKVFGYANESFASSYEHGNEGTGALISPEFTIKTKFITFLVGGGKLLGQNGVQLYVEGELVREIAGNDDLALRRCIWTVREHVGKKAQIRIIDNSETAATFVDEILMKNFANARFPSATRNGKPFIPGMQTSETLIPGLQHPESSDLSIFATHEEHGIRSPTAITFDAKGRTYLAETWRFGPGNGIDDNRRRQYWILEDISNQKTEDRMTMYENWYHKHPASFYTQNTDRIRLFHDNDGDLKADSQSLFVDDFNDPLDGTLAGVFAYKDTVFAANIPHIWALKDSNGDDKVTREERQSIQEGFGVRVSFSGHDLNGFALGPDGRIYATMGDRGFNIETKEGIHYPYPGQGAILRFDPDGSNMEAIHIGLRNPKEIAFDIHGNAFSVDNNSDQGDQARVVYVVDGGDSGWRMGHQVLNSFHTVIGLEDRPINRWLQERMWEPANPQQPHYIVPPVINLTSGPSGLTYEPGGYFKDFQNHFLICDFRGGATYSGIQAFSVQEQGAAMQVSNSRTFTWGIAATDIEFDYKGNCFITDFGEGWVSSEQGRICSLSPKSPELKALGTETSDLFKAGFEDLSSESLFELLKHKDMRVRLHAHIELAAKPDTTPQLLQLASTSDDQLVRLHCTWALGIQARRGQNAEVTTQATEALLSLLEHSDHQVRMRSAEALGESPMPYGTALLPLLKDPSPRVRAFAALALARKPLETPREATEKIIELLEENSNQDAYLRHAGVMALQVALSSEELATYTTHPSTAIRLAAVLSLRRHVSPLLTEFLNDKEDIIRNAAIRAIHDQEIKPAQVILCEHIERITTEHADSLTPMLLRRLIHCAYRVGGEHNLALLLNIATNSNLDEHQRLEVLRLLTLWKQPHQVDQSLGRHSPLPERDDSYLLSQVEAKLPTLLELDEATTIASLKLALELNITIENTADIARTAKSPKVRAQALLTLAATNEKEAIALAADMVNDIEVEPVNAALNIISRSEGPEAEAALVKATKATDAKIRQKAWTYLGNLKSQSSAASIAKAIESLLTTDADLECALEILKSAKKRKEPSIKKAYKAYNKAIKGNFDKEWEVALHGGNAQAGAKIFQSNGAAQCMRCHAVGQGHGAGGNAGPNLAGVFHRGDRKHLLESMILPSKAIADGFGVATITFHNERTTQGTVLSSTDKHLDVKLPSGVKRVLRKDISKLELSPSAMPDMKPILNKAQLRDVVAFLANQTQDVEHSETGREPELLDPETLSAQVTEVSSHDRGKALYATCAACHGPEGKPLAPVFPPLAGSEWVSGPKENLIRIQIRGLMGPIEVAGKEYNNIMPPSTLNDQQIADVLNYVRATFADKQDEITVEEVAAVRQKEAGQPMLTAKELVTP